MFDDEPTKPTRLIRLNEVKRRVGLSRSTIYRRIKDGSFPKSHSLGGPIVAWTEAEIENWIETTLSPVAKKSV